MMDKDHTEETQILIVEDEFLLAKSLGKNLRVLGYGVPAVVPSGEEAVQKAGEIRPDLVLMDIKLQGKMDGVEAAEEIRTRFDIPVVYMTGYADEMTLQRAKITEPFGYILKPFQARELRSTIEMALYKHEMEKNLRASEEKYRTILENIEDGYYEVDIVGNLTFFNDSLCRLYGYAEHELMGMNNRQYMDDRTAKVAYQTFNEVYRTGNSAKAFDWEVIRKDGTKRFVEASISLMRDPTGEPVGFRGVVRDITDRKRAEEEIKQRNRELAALNAISQDITSSLDLDETLQRIADSTRKLTGSRRGRILLVNPQARQFLKDVNSGYPLEEKGTYDYERFEQGISGWVVREKRSALVPDVLADERSVGRSLAASVRHGTKSVAVAPLLVRGEVIGTLSAVNLCDDPIFTPESMALVERLAAQAAVAIQNARLYDKMQRHLKAMTTLQKVGMELTSSLDLSTLLQGIADSTLKLTNADYVHIFSLDPETGEFTQRTVSWLPEAKKPPIGWPRNRGLSAAVVRTNEPVVIEKATDHPLYSAPEARKWGVKSVAGFPLKGKWGLMGILNLVFLQPHAFSEDELRVLALLADQAAIAIENARLFEEIEERRMYLEGVLGAAPDAIVTLDDRFQIVEWNAGAERLFGYSREEAIGQDLDHLVTNPDVFEEAVGFTQRVMGGKELPPTEAVRYRKDGSPVDVLVAGSPILVGDELIGVVAVYTDITERVRMEETLRALALLDELTGLYNRRGFLTLAEQQLKTANRAKRRMMLLFADLDGLKQINDTFGHPEGDRALIETADTLRETFRESDIIARFAGDEFVVLAIETDSASAEALTARLRKNLETRNARRDRCYTLSLSVGVARYDPEHPCSIEELLIRADRAMYEGKGNNTPG